MDSIMGPHEMQQEKHFEDSDSFSAVVHTDNGPASSESIVTEPEQIQSPGDMTSFNTINSDGLSYEPPQLIKKNFETESNSCPPGQYRIINEIHCPKSVNNSNIPNNMPLDMVTATPPATATKAPAKAEKRMAEFAYQRWLLSKQRAQAEQQAQRQREAERLRKYKLERKLSSEARYKEWLEVNKMRKLPSLVSKVPSNTRVATSKEASAAKVAEWLSKKQNETVLQKQMQCKQKEHERKQMQERQLQSAENWQKWYALSASKPRPMPFCQGWQSLQSCLVKPTIMPRARKVKLADQEMDEAEKERVMIRSANIRARRLALRR